MSKFERGPFEPRDLTPMDSIPDEFNALKELMAFDSIDEIRASEEGVSLAVSGQAAQVLGHETGRMLLEEIWSEMKEKGF